MALLAFFPSLLRRVPALLRIQAVEPILQLRLWRTLGGIPLTHTSGFTPLTPYPHTPNPQRLALWHTCSCVNSSLANKVCSELLRGSSYCQQCAGDWLVKKKKLLFVAHTMFSEIWPLHLTYPSGSVGIVSYSRILRHKHWWGLKHQLFSYSNGCSSHWAMPPPVLSLEHVYRKQQVNHNLHWPMVPRYLHQPKPSRDRGKAL